MSMTVTTPTAEALQKSGWPNIGMPTHSIKSILYKPNFFDLFNALAESGLDPVYQIFYPKDPLKKGYHIFINGPNGSRWSCVHKTNPAEAAAAAWLAWKNDKLKFAVAK